MCMYELCSIFCKCFKKYCCCKQEYEISDDLLDFERPIAML